MSGRDANQLAADAHEEIPADLLPDTDTKEPA